jgi:hypothetical protein
MACPSQTIKVALINTTRSDHWFALFGPSGYTIFNAYNVKEGELVSYTFKSDWKCASITLAGTCFGNRYGACSGSYIIYNVVAAPTSRPITLHPTAMPVTSSIAPTSETMRCPFLNSPNQCKFYSCSSRIAISLHLNSGNYYHVHSVLYDNDGFQISGENYGTWYFYNYRGCQIFNLVKILCKTFCDGYYIISNARSAPSSIPSVASTGKSFAPTSAAPNTPIQMTTFASYVDCDFVSLQYPETKPCFFNACEGTYLSIVNIFHKGEYNGNMEASLYNSVSKIYSASDFYFVDGFTTSAYAFCQVILNLVSNIDYVL